MYEKKVLGLEEVQKAMEAMIKEAPKGSGRPVSLAIVDEVGNLIMLVRTDGARPFNSDMAIKKAYTAARWKSDTAALAERIPKKYMQGILEFGNEYTTVLGGVAISKRGEPGTVYGGIGCAGRIPADEDDAIARVGLKAMQDALWPSK